MSNITSVENIAFVNYQITPIPAAFKQSLYSHLLYSVWGYRGMVDEDIRVVVSTSNNSSWIREIRYQFGEDFDLCLITEIGELIDKEINIWVTKNIFQ
jgi:hypothetical protein